ncbi:6736_t:CDS:2 [Funneliformis caledonium]|uniref:6736_t:CDS:1 n=1 Tax=Funneliformis caledonium TaxID=1117310 RepID=A0A9N9AF02_9GLOM|nr:6736_t:CDS:2 [Funneliformis caledonium]
MYLLYQKSYEKSTFGDQKFGLILRMRGYDRGCVQSRESQNICHALKLKNDVTLSLNAVIRAKNPIIHVLGGIDYNGKDD